MSGAREPRLSFAVVTRDRPSSLERMLISLRTQAAQPWEVVVSDDSNESAGARVRALAEEHGCRYVRGPQRGLYANRNSVASACLGTHVRTVDDDHEFPPGHVGACLQAVGEDENAIWIVGERLPNQTPDEGYRCPPQLTPRGFSATPQGNSGIWAIADGATIYPADLFRRGLRFAEYFPFGAAYLEWGSRLHWLGYRIRHLAATYVIHHYDPATRSYLDRRVDLSSRFFAMFAHSFLYQPNLGNRALSAGEVIRRVATNPSLGLPSLGEGWRAYRRQRAVALGDRAARTEEH